MTDSGPLPLTGFTVVDMSTSYAGPTATMYLADMGADVIKVERPPHGDDARHWGPPFQDGWSAWYRSVNRNKRSVGLDVGTEEGRHVLDLLLDQADVFVQSLNPSKLERLALDPASIRRDRPRLVYCAISGFGLDGPDRDLPGYDLIAQARSGLMSVTGEAGGTPQRVSTALSDIVTGITAAFAVTAALHGRAATGAGTTVDVSLLDVGLAMMAPRIASFLAGEVEPRPSGATDSVLSIYQTFQTADRPIVLAVGNDAMWKRLCAVVGLDELADDPRCATNELRRRHREELVGAVETKLRQRPGASWVAELMCAGVPSSLINFLSDVTADPQVAARDALVTLVDDASPPCTVVNHPWRLEGTAPAHRSPRPLGADTDAVLEDLSIAASDIAALVDKGVLWRTEPV